MSGKFEANARSGTAKETNRNRPKLRVKTAIGEEVFKPHTQKNLTTEKEKIKNGKTRRG